MKVGIHADPVFQKTPGGLPVYVRRLLDALVEAPDPDEISLILASSAPHPPGRWRLPQIRSRLPLRVLYPLWNYARLPKVGARLDVVHATALVIPPAGRAALVSTVHDLTVELFPNFAPWPWRQIYRRGLRLALARSDVILVDAEAIRQRLVADMGVNEQRVMVAPLAPTLREQAPGDDGLLARLGLDGPYFLNVGTLEPRKNQPALIRAFGNVAHRLEGWRLVIAGTPGWGAEEVERTAREEGLDVVLTGALRPEELRTLYDSAGAFAFPSHHEGFGLPLLDALDLGIPSVAGDEGALREVADDAALFVDPADIDALSEALFSLATNEDLRRRLASAGPERAAKFDWARTAEATRDAYRAAAR